MKTLTEEGKYIYCIIRSDQPLAFGPLGIGERGDVVHTVCVGDIAAVVSDSPVKSYAVSRENLLAHEKAIEEVMKRHPVLPVRFCTIARDEEKVKKILETEHDRFSGLLKSIKGKKELGLKAMLQEDLIYEDILEKYGEIRRLKEAIAREAPAKTHSRRMEIGRQVEAALQKEKGLYKDEIINALAPLAREVKVNAPYGEMMIISAAFLVDNGKEAEFDRNVGALADKAGEKIKFKYTGTLPPFNFVNLVIETGRY